MDFWLRRIGVPTMQKLLRASTLLAATTLAPRALAHQPHEGDIWATVAPGVMETRSNDPRANDPTATGGITAEGDVDYNGGVEIAMLYVDKLYARRKGDDAIVERIKRMYVTTGYRHWFFPSLSFGGAFFSSYSMGDAKVVVDDVAEGHELKTTARAITEYGMDFSVQYELFHVQEVAMTLDARYSLSLPHKSREDADTMGILLGCKWRVPKSG